MKLHAQNQLYTSISFWDSKVLKASLGMHGHVWPQSPKLIEQFITSIDMKLHAQNQLYTSFSFWDLKLLTASLGMLGHAWHHSCKITPSIYSFNRYIPVCAESTLYFP